MVVVITQMNSSSGQSYEIRMLDNRKMGELPELNGKLVKVSKGLTADNVSSLKC